MEYVGAIASVPGVIAVVNLLKEFGITGKWSMIAAVLIGIALNITNYHLGGTGVYQAAVTGLIGGLGAAGLYDLRGSGSTQ